MLYLEILYWKFRRVYGMLVCDKWDRERERERGNEHKQARKSERKGRLKHVYHL